MVLEFSHISIPWENRNVFSSDWHVTMKTKSLMPFFENFLKIHGFENIQTKSWFDFDFGFPEIRKKWFDFDFVNSKSSDFDLILISRSEICMILIWFDIAKNQNHIDPGVNFTLMEKYILDNPNHLRIFSEYWCLLNK